MNIFKFADIIDKRIIATYYPNQKDRYCAKFESCDLSEGNFLQGIWGEGDSFEEAIKDYIKQIRGKKLIFNPMSTEFRQSFIVPEDLED